MTCSWPAEKQAGSAFDPQAAATDWVSPIFGAGRIAMVKLRSEEEEEEGGGEGPYSDHTLLLRQ